MEPLLTARGLVKRYGRVTALDHADFDLYPGEILAVIGDNGAGKSSLIKAISGAMIPDEGEMRLDGRPIAFRSPMAARDAGIETVYQNLALSPALSIADNMFLGREIRKPGFLGDWLRMLDRPAMEKRARDKAMELLDLVLLTRLAHEPARVLSGGQRKLLELARVMMADPAIILLDEPAAGVNATLLEVIIDRIRDINARGITFLLIEHNIDMVTRLCNRVLVMAGGQLLCQGTAEEVARDPRVIEAYLGGAA
jgi:branched-chain amino acid transport system ATP-binding protein